MADKAGRVQAKQERADVSLRLPYRARMIATLSRAAQSLAPVGRRLADALTEIREREARRKEIEGQWRARASVDFFVERLHRAEQRYEQSQLDEDLAAACLEECLLEKARRRAGVAQQQITYGMIDTQFRTEFSDEANRELLTRACSLRLKVATSECERITSTEEKRLSAEGFTSDEISKWPSIKRARDVVERFRSLLESLPARQPENIWKAANTILEE